MDVDSVKAKQKPLDDNFTSMEKNAAFADELLKKLHSDSVKTKDDFSETRKKLFYLEAYSRRKKLKFEGIPERNSQQIPEEENGTGQQGKALTENNQAVLTKFLEIVLGIQDVHRIEFQRVHRLGKPGKENDKDRVTIARFLRYSDRERVFKCG